MATDKYVANFWDPHQLVLYGTKTDLIIAFQKACEVGSLFFVRWIAKKIARHVYTRKFCRHVLWENGYLIAARNNKVDIMKELELYGAFSYHSAMEEACQFGALEVIKYLLETSVELDTTRRRRLIRHASLSNKRDEIEELLDPLSGT